MFEGVRNAAPTTQRMCTSKKDAEQANRLMIRQTLGYVSSRVRAASTVKAEETQPNANTMRCIGSVGRNILLPSGDDSFFAFVWSDSGAAKSSTPLAEVSCGSVRIIRTRVHDASTAALERRNNLQKFAGQTRGSRYEPGLQ